MHEKDTPPIVKTSVELFTMDDIKQGIKKFASGKVEDIYGLQVENLKWVVEPLAPHIKGFFKGSSRLPFRENGPLVWSFLSLRMEISITLPTTTLL